MTMERTCKPVAAETINKLTRVSRMLLQENGIIKLKDGVGARIGARRFRLFYCCLSAARRSSRC